MSLLLAAWAPMAQAQETLADTDPDPLRPADTSSPRATLRTFLENADQAIAAWREGGPTPASIRAYVRAVDTLDFSATPDQNAYTVRTRRMLLLKELLDRVELPPEDQIPGQREVAEGTLTRWAIPETSITIGRIAEGPRAGAFLFSAETVEQLDRLYRMAKHLPYRPGAMVGIYEEYARSDRTEEALERLVRRRLKPVETSSPRSTLFGFLSSVNRAYRLVMDADAALRADPPTMTLEEARQAEQDAGDLLHRAVLTLDLSQVPRALRDDVGLETVLQLKEILDRLQLPPVDAVPDAGATAAARQGTGGAFAQSVGPLRWRYPNTEIEIVEITEGERQGAFLFSAGSVRDVPRFYDHVESLPYRRNAFAVAVLGFEGLEVSDGFFDYYISTPGYLIAPLHFLGRLVDGLPGSFKVLYAGQTVWQWAGMALGVLIVIAAAVVLLRLFDRLAAGRRPPWDSWLKVVPPVLVAAISFPIADFIDRDLNATGEVLTYVTAGNRLIAIAMAAWVAVSLCRAVAETAVAAPHVIKADINATMLRIAANVVGFLVAAWIVIAGVQSLGVNMIPLIAGLGVGGLAVALAAQRTFANFIGSVILFINKPVKVGDFCRYGDQIGTVESIGLISTRVRSLERTIVTVPNSEFSEMKLDNFAKRDQRLMKFVLQLRYETTPDQMRQILIKLRELLLGHPMVTPDPARVRFVGFGAFSKDVEIFAYLRCQDQNTFLALQEDILLRMEDIILAAGSGFAFPSQTAYLARDTGLDAQRRGQAETEIESLRARGQLPFPEFADEDRERLEDTLDYPPQGAIGHQRRDGQATPPPELNRPPDEIPAEEVEPGERGRA